ncbi:unnamed protein product, partial [Rangifer tarandus platyrhynchus]
TGLIHELPLMKSACPSSERLVGPLGPKSTGRESLFPERATITEPAHRAYGAPEPQLLSLWAQSARSLTGDAAVASGSRLPQLENSACSDEDPAQPKGNKLAN